MKKNYVKPEIQVVTINHSVQLLQASKRNLGGLKSNAGFNLGFGEGSDETGIDSMHNSECLMLNEADAWYSLDGRKLDGKPSAKGMYIKNGKKVVVK